MEAIDAGMLRALGRPAAYPLDPSAAAGVEAVQTHISSVFLTGARVYKLRKAVDLGFVRFDSRQLRSADCLHELALNRRLAPDVYLGVAPVLPAPAGGAGSAWQVGPVGEALLADAAGRAAPEHCVVMRRLPAGRDALSLLAAGRLRPEQLEAVAGVLSRFHAAGRLPAASLGGREEWLAGLEAPARENFRALAAASLPDVDPAWSGRVGRASHERFDRDAERFDARRREGRVVDGHGDVHLQHVWFESDASAPLLIDCIEFNAALRRIDAASEVAFLAMDLVYRGRPELAERFLRDYAAASDDFGLYGVVDWFASYRAGVRAKVAGLAAGDAAIAAEQRAAAAASARRHLELAEACLAPPGRGALVLVCGVVGTGKSSVAAGLADACGGVVVGSDRTRKHLAGLGPTGRAAAAPGAGLYTRERTEQVYAALLERAAPVLDSGRVAILDATFARRAHREAARRFAEARAVPIRLVEVRCAEAVARERLAQREAEGRDASDAGPGLLAWSAARFEPPDEWPAATRHVVATDRETWREGLAAPAEGLPSRWHQSC